MIVFARVAYVRNIAPKRMSHDVQCRPWRTYGQVTIVPGGAGRTGLTEATIQQQDHRWSTEPENLASTCIYSLGNTCSPCPHVDSARALVLPSATHVDSILWALVCAIIYSRRARCIPEGIGIPVRITTMSQAVSEPPC
jgi:hypothetical protein